MDRDKLVILDFGGTQSRAVARKVRGEQFYCEILPCDTPISEIRSCSPKGILSMSWACPFWPWGTRPGAWRFSWAAG